MRSGMAKPNTHGLATVIGLSDPGYRRWRKVRRWVWTGFLLVAIIIFVWWAMSTKFLTIKRVVIVDQVHVTPQVVPLEQLGQSADKWRGKWLWADTKKLQSTMLKQFPALASASVSTRFPDTLELRFLPRVALCQLITPTGIYLVDRTGIIFARLDKPTGVLPTLQAATRPVVGKQVSATGVTLGLAIVSAIRNTEPSLQQVSLHDGQLDIKLAGPPLIYIDDNRQPDDVIPELLALLRRFAADNRYPIEVDMRFDRPVLRY